MNLTLRNPGKQLALLCAVIYFVSYLTRHNYAAVLTEVIASGTASSTAAAVTTVGFITYGFGQLISGFLGDRLRPQRLILLGLLLTTLMNLSLPLCHTGWQMCLVWGVNGGAQALLWPPMVKLLSRLSKEDYQDACVNVTIGGSAGTIGIYFLAPLVLSLSDWHSVFYACASIGLLAALLWSFRINSLLDKLESTQQQTQQVQQKKKLPAACIPVTALVIFAIILQGILRDGITTWAPVYLYEVYHLTPSFSILISVTIPIMSVVGVKTAALVYNRKIPGARKCAGVFFLAGFLFALLLLLAKGASPILFSGLAALLTACMHGINMLLISVFPLHYQKFGRISFFSGLLNSATYVGSALASFGFDRVARAAGWNWVIFLWAVISAAGALLCFWAHRQGFPDEKKK